MAKERTHIPVAAERPLQRRLDAEEELKETGQEIAPPQLKLDTGSPVPPPDETGKPGGKNEGFSYQLKSASNAESDSPGFSPTQFAVAGNNQIDAPIQRKAAFAPSGGGNGKAEATGSAMGKMESFFQADFSNVNIHENSSSATKAGALAYAQGNDIHFAPGQFNPETSSGQELLGHELTHIVQQRQGRVKPNAEVGGMPVNNDRGLEKEADDMGRKAASGQAPVTQAKAPPQGKEKEEAIQRKTAEPGPELNSQALKTENPFTAPAVIPNFTNQEEVQDLEESKTAETEIQAPEIDVDAPAEAGGGEDNPVGGGGENPAANPNGGGINLPKPEFSLNGMPPQGTNPLKEMGQGMNFRMNLNAGPSGAPSMVSAAPKMNLKFPEPGQQNRASAQFKVAGPAPMQMSGDEDSGLLGGIRSRLNSIVSGLQSGWSGLTSMASSAFDGVMNTVSSLTSGLQNMATSALDGISGAWDSLSETASSMADSFKQTVGNAVGSVSGFMGSITGAIMNLDAAALSAAWAGLTGAISGVWGTVQAAGQAMFEQLTGLWTGLGERFSGVIDSLTQQATAIYDQMGQAARAVQERVQSAWNSLQTQANQMDGVLGGVARALVYLIQTLISWGTEVWNGIQQGWNALTEQVSSFMSGVSEQISSIWDSLQSYATSFWEGITSLWDSLSSWVSEQIDYFVQGISNLMDRFNSFSIGSIVSKIAEYAPMFKAVQEAVQNPDAAMTPMVNDLATPLEERMPGESVSIGTQRASSAQGGGGNATTGGVPVQMMMASGVAQMSGPRSTTGLGEVISGFSRHIQAKWAEIHVWQMIKDMLWTLLWPWPTVGHEIAAFFTEDLATIFSNFYMPANLFSDPLGCLHDLYTNLLHILDIPLALWRRLNNIAMALMGWITLALIIIGAIGGTTAGGIIGGIVSAAASLGLATPAGASAGGAAGGLAGAGAGFAAGMALGEMFLISFGVAHVASIGKALTDLFTSNQTTDEKEDDYSQLADSLIALGITAVLVFVGWLASKLAGAVLNLIRRIRGPRPVEAPLGEVPGEVPVEDPVEVPGERPGEEPVERPGEEPVERPAEDEPVREDEPVVDPLEAIKTAAREHVARIRARMTEMRTALDRFPEDSPGRTSIEERLSDVENTLDRYERDITDAVSEEEVGMIRDELTELENTLTEIDGLIREENTLADQEELYEALGDEPRHIDILENEASNAGAHVLERHGPQIPMERSLDANGLPDGTRTIEGRIHGDSPWNNPGEGGMQNFSAKWNSIDAINATVNRYLRMNWDAIRSDLAQNPVGEGHAGTMVTETPVGEGYYNGNYGQGGPRVPVGPVPVNIVTIVVRLIQGSNPPGYYIHTAFPNLRGF